MSLLRSSCNILQYSKIIFCSQTQISIRPIKRWVAPTLRELNRRKKMIGPEAPTPRSEFLEWNYRAEIFSFGKRLQEEFDLSLLSTAFTQMSYIAKEQAKRRELGIEETNMNMDHNEELSQRGGEIAKDYVHDFLKLSLPKVPQEGQTAITSFLLSTETLSNLAFHLGMKDILLDAEYPPSDISMAKSLLAVVGALEMSSGIERAYLFVRDFICTQLNQKDLLEVWHIENPVELLARICKEKNLPFPEPRLLGDCGRNTVLAVYHVGIYSNKNLLGIGFGEDIDTAVKTAALNALQRMFGILDNMKPFDFKLQLDIKKEKLKQ